MNATLECRDCGALREVPVPGPAGRCPHCNSLWSLVVEVTVPREQLPEVHHTAPLVGNGYPLRLWRRNT